MVIWHDYVSDALLQFPFTVVERADVSRLQPSRDAVEVERVLRSPRVRYWKKEGEGSQEKDRMLTLQMPHAALHSSLVAETWFAWQSMPGAHRR